MIAGGLGYIGSALCELYKHQPQHRIVVVDKKLIPERIAAFPVHFRYVQGDIGNLDLMGRLLDGVDVLHMLAAEVEAEKSVHKERAVWENNFEVPKRLIEICPSTTRIMFPSTGNVFGGLDPDQKFMDLTEEDQPKPKYPYAETKRAMEEFLLGSDKNFVILRFGTNYGYAPGIRFNLVTNIFTRRMLLGEDLIIHGGGENWRPTACVWECAKALEFLSGRQDSHGEIFHVVHENFKIKDLAQRILSNGFSSSKLQFIAKEVPFNSYALSSAKIESLGFRFEWDLEKAVKQMIQVFHALTPEPGLPIKE
jgi:nucleoside-diphosphate-sugar epimerase